MAVVPIDDLVIAIYSFSRILIAICPFSRIRRSHILESEKLMLIFNDRMEERVEVSSVNIISSL